MDDPFSQLPKAAVLVYAGVLTATAANTAVAGQAEAPLVTQASTQEQPSNAPTCGPSCHNGGDFQEQLVAPPPEPDPVAPTCGPQCHDSNSPPLISPKGRKGCAVTPVLQPEAELALLGLGLSLGVGLSIASRRRKRSSES